MGYREFVTEQEREHCAHNLRMALEMFDLGVDMKRQQLKRAHPELDDAAIEDRIDAWLVDKPIDPTVPGAVVRRAS